jgi:hypothetical protein
MPGGDELTRRLFDGTIRAIGVNSVVSPRSMFSGALGASMNKGMLCWENILHQTVSDSAVGFDRVGILRADQRQYPGGFQVKTVVDSWPVQMRGREL